MASDKRSLKEVCTPSLISLISLVSLGDEALDKLPGPKLDGQLSPIRTVQANLSLLENTSLRAEIQFLAAVTPENEVAIRTLHRTLGACRHVEVHQDYYGKEIWVIPAYENT